VGEQPRRVGRRQSVVLLTLFILAVESWLVGCSSPIPGTPSPAPRPAPVRFGAGWYLIGHDVPAGFYRSKGVEVDDPAGYYNTVCLWEVRQDPGLAHFDPGQAPPIDGGSVQRDGPDSGLETVILRLGPNGESMYWFWSAGCQEWVGER